MLSTSLATALPELIEQLLAAESISDRTNLVNQNGAMRERDFIVGTADAVNRMAREDVSRAERLSEIACWLAELSDDDFCRARTRRVAGNLQVLRGKHTDALQTFQTSIDQFASIGEEIETAATLSSSLQPLIYLGRYPEALERAQQAREIAGRHKDELLLARLDINSGNILHRQDRFTDAVLHYKRALVILDRLGQQRDCAIAWVNLAVCYISLNEFLQAEKAYEKARSISERESMPTIVAQADYNIAYLYYHRGEYVQAIQLYQKTRLYCLRVEDQYHSALCDLDQSEMYLELHLNHDGTQLAQQAFTAFEKLSLGYEAAKALVWLGLAVHQDGKPSKALEILGTAQERMRIEKNTVWVALLDFYRGIILQQEGRLNEALRSCRAAQGFFSSFPNSRKAVQTYLLRASLHLALNEVSDARQWSTTSIEAAQRLQSPYLLWQVYALQGQIEEASDSVSTATDFYEKALHFLENSPNHPHGEESKISLFSSRLAVYEALISFNASTVPEEDTTAKIFDLVEKAKSRELAEMLSFRANILPTPSRNRSSLVQQVKTLREELNWHYRQVDTADFRTAEDSGQQAHDIRLQIRGQEEALVKTLRELRPMEEEFHALQSGSTISISEIRATIRPDEVIVEYFEARGLLYACVLRRESLHVVPLARRHTIREMLRSLQSQFSKFNRGDEYINRFATSLSEGVRTTLRAIHRELIEPIREHINGLRLIIVPHGPLHYLPFNALFDGSRYLYEGHVISYAGSASLYCLSSRKKIGIQDHDLILLSTGPDKKRPAETTARMGHVLPNARAFIGENAGVEVLEAFGPGTRFIHLDAEMRLRRDNPLFSTFTLGNREMSILDAYNLHLPCSMAGLSGTGSGIQHSGNGEEVHALARGLEYAGVQTLLMPLWNVPDDVLVPFLEEFYGRVSSEADKPLVFQQTVENIRSRFDHPYYWASFILRGNTGRP